MKYYSLNNKLHTVTFQQAVIQGLAPDNGLYYPEEITALPPSFFNNIENLTNHEIAFQVIKQFVGNEIPEVELNNIISDALCFDFPIIELTDKMYSLELFHGPTMAFKDVGARFMSRCVAYFNKNNSEKSTVLVATSGDTGGAVASGFLDAENTNVVLLYPSKKVSDIQERQLTTLKKNSAALEVHGNFDDYQNMVKKAFLDPDLKFKNLTSANSINIARWLPQMFYFFYAYKQLKKYKKPLIISCPSGNFGNICAGVLSKKLGLPVAHFVAATNANNTVSRFLKNGVYEPKPSTQTISNAMDVGNPSNFIRIQEMYDNDLSKFKKDFSSFYFTDVQTKDALCEIHKLYNYIADPHGAIGYLGLKKIMLSQPNSIGFFLETAHPIKFLETVEPILNIKLKIPWQIESVLNKEKISTQISNYTDLKKYLLTH